jgi:hypothetical protein
MTGVNNHAGDLTPLTSPYGQAMFAAAGQLVAHPLPIQGHRQPFGGTVGGMATRSASVIPLSAESGYYGDLPQDRQGVVQAPEPWDRP